MELFIEFLGREWALVGSLMILVALMIFNDSRRSGTMVPPQIASGIVNKQDGVFVDVREAKDFRAGHVAGSVNIPFSKFKDSLSELEKYRGKPIVLICKFGQTTGAAGKMLVAAGFPEVYRMTGGLTEWENCRFPTVKK
ncbi:MAG: hypothetical protein RL336_968 [Pseudomonadota bacterium]|jgi:rhodanese-related sulfurtransferase